MAALFSLIAATLLGAGAPSFTHELTSAEAYYTTGPQQARPPEGQLAPGTRVELMEAAGSYSRVRLADGRTAYVASASLRPLGGKPGQAEFERKFFELCDVACRELNSEGRKVPFYHDSYAVRALAVANDLTGKPEYMAACRKWADRMVDFQDKMTPAGAYSMNYGRKPGETQGGWYVADSASIALGVLATGVRSQDAAARKRYYDSVSAFARLVMENYVRPSGGVTDGLWPKFDGEWWCSTGIFGSLAFVLYRETGNEAYLKVGREALGWLNRQGFENSEHISWTEAAPAVLMYVLEAYSAGMPYLEPGSDLEKASLGEVRRALAWMEANQAGRGAKTPWDYNKQWGCKMGGLPFHMQVYARHLAGGEAIAAAADKEMAHLGTLLPAAATPKLTQLTCFALMSLAERVFPGGIYRSDRVTSFPGPAPGATRAKVDKRRIMLENNVIRAEWSLEGDRFALESVSQQGGPALRPAGTTFQVVMGDGRRLTTADFRTLGPPQLIAVPGKPEAFKLGARPPEFLARVEFVSRDGALHATWQSGLRHGANYLRQRVTLKTEKADVDVKEIVFLDLPAPGATVAGEVEGSPVVWGNWFFGCEHPMAANRVDGERAVCSVGSFGPVTAGQECSRTMVIGMAPTGQTRRAFLHYIGREQGRPYQPFLHYNSWYDIAWVDRKMDQQGCRNVIEQFGRELVEKRFTRLDSFVFDDGWDDNRTLWRFHDGFPGGFVPLVDDAARYGSGVGVWLSPWGGYAQAKKERLEYGRRQGFEMNDRGFSLAGPKYYERFRDACAEMIDKQRVNYFKFDGIAAGSSAAGAGPKYAADVDALLRLCADLRRLRGDVYLSLTTGTWPSPFWLHWGDSIWRGGGDMGFHGAGSRRQQWITYRDMIEYQRIVRRGPLYPLNSLMTQGIAHARLGSANLPVDRKDMADEIRSFFASGTQLQELYITPGMMTAEAWDLLAEGARWSRRNADVLADVHWIGGDPGKAQVYGFAAWCARQGMLALRNPGAEEATLGIDVGEALELPPGAARTYRLRCPWSGAGLGELVVQAGKEHTFRLAPFEVQVFDALPVR